MIIRIVQMTFREDAVNRFLRIFDQSKDKIASFDGCRHLELWQDSVQTNVFFTYSYWQSSEHLENYRRSEIFKTTWSQTRPLFRKKAKAWSVKQVRKV